MNDLSILRKMLQKQGGIRRELKKVFDESIKDHSFTPEVGEIFSLVNERNHYSHRGLNPLSNDTSDMMKFCASRIKEIDKRIQMLLEIK